MRRIALLLLVLLTQSACFLESDQDTSDPNQTAVVVIHSSAGDQTLSVEVAATPEARAAGLMGRESLEPYDGMVFTWDQPVNASFWMKDTLIPLSIAFWDKHRKIVAIFDMDPCTADPCPTYDPGVDILGAIEVAHGELARRGVAVGDEVELAFPA